MKRSNQTMRLSNRMRLQQQERARLHVYLSRKQSGLLSRAKNVSANAVLARAFVASGSAWAIGLSGEASTSIVLSLWSCFLRCCDKPLRSWDGRQIVCTCSAGMDAMRGGTHHWDELFCGGGRPHGPWEPPQQSLSCPLVHKPWGPRRSA